MSCGRILPVAVVSWGLLFIAGCTTRRLEVRAVTESGEPVVGAEVYINHEYAGRTPLEAEFGEYGTYLFVLRAERFIVARREIELSAPWYGYEPLQLIADILPFKISDSRELKIVLEPRAAISESLQTARLNHLLHRVRSARGELESAAMKDSSDKSPRAP